MSDIVKGAFGGMWPLLAGWILPTAIVLAVFGVFVLPSLETTPPFSDLVEAAASTQALALLTSAVLVGWLLSCLQTPLYRLLEGYLGWPDRLREARTQHHVGQRDALRSRLDDAEGGLDEAEALEEFLRYPDDDSQVAPTQLGNAIRRFEYYGQNRYQLDSQYLWFQLRASVPESLAREVDAARAGVDFFVCLVYMLAALAAASLASVPADTGRWSSLVALSIAALGAAVAAYRAAVVASDGWAAAVRAMVDLGRISLASSLGLAVPEKLEDERRMWQAVGWLSVYPYDDEGARVINEFRARAGSHRSGG